MSALAGRVLLSRSGITRLVDRLGDDGAVMRTACASDGRGAEAVLTRAGMDRVCVASRTHLAGVQRYFLAVVDDDRDAIERGLTRVADAVGEVGGGDPACLPERT
jgi:DNA-binding MarR family transcriptional regulator